MELYITEMWQVWWRNEINNTWHLDSAHDSSEKALGRAATVAQENGIRVIMYHKIGNLLFEGIQDVQT